MKRFMAIVFTFILSLTACIPAAFAEGRSMSEEEQNAFVCDISLSVIIPFLREIKPLPFLYGPHDPLEEKGESAVNMAEVIRMFRSGNNDFDRQLGINSRSFREALGEYHEHVLNAKLLAKCPLDYRGLTSFVIKKLMDQGIECRYVKLATVKGELHDVAQYKFGDQWYICDLYEAMKLYMFETYCADREFVKNLKARELGDPTASCAELLKMPKEVYKSRFCSVRSPWEEMELTGEVLRKRTCLVLKHDVCSGVDLLRMLAGLRK